MLHQRLQPSGHTQPRRTCAGGGPCRLAGANAWVIPSRPLHHPRAQVICSAAKQSLYEVLGVPQTASEREIKSAYRKRALKLHPDVNKAPDAQQQFMEAKMAFQTLGDAKQRAEYDRRLRMGFGSSADWQSRTSSSSAYGSSSYGSSGARRPYSKPEDNYTFDDLMRDLDKEFSSWANSKPASTGKAKSLLEELEMIGEEFVDFLEGALGTKESDKSSSSSASGKAEGSSSSSSSKSKAPRNSMEEFDQLWKKYGESSAQSAAAGQSTSSSGAGSSSKNSSTNGASSTSSRGAGSSSNGTGSTSRPGASSEDDIDAMLAALKKKVRKEG